MQRSHALNLLGQIANTRAKPDGSLARYREAMRSTAELVERSPNDPHRLFDHAQNVFWIGEISRRRGEAAQAEVAYREYKSLADRMVAAEPDNPKWRMEVLYAKENLGIVIYNQRRFDEAERIFDGSIAPMKFLAERNVGNPDYQKEFSTLLAWLADTLRSQGHFDRAIALRVQQLSFLRGLIDGGRTDVVFREHLIPAYQALGTLFISQGETGRGIEQLRLAVVEADRLIPVEPDNAYWRGLGTSARLDLAKTLLAVNRLTEARAVARAGCNDTSRVLARDPSTTWRSLRTACLSVRARLALKGNAPANAMRLATQGVASARTERSADSIKDRYGLAAAQRLLGDIYQQLGNVEGAKAAWTEGLAPLPVNKIERPWEMNERAQLLRRLGRSNEARSLFERLTKTGYRNAV